MNVISNNREENLFPRQIDGWDFDNAVNDFHVGIGFADAIHPDAEA